MAVASSLLSSRTNVRDLPEASLTTLLNLCDPNFDCEIELAPLG
jgi:hypothetical protein